MRSIDSNKIIGVRIDFNEEEYVVSKGGARNEKGFSLLSFKSDKDFDKFVKNLKSWKKGAMEYAEAHGIGKE